jgi:hypothetical protein
MFIACDYKNGKYGILDITDGVVEYYTLNEILGIMSTLDINIRGVKFSNGNVEVKIIRVPSNWSTSLKEFVNITDYRRKLRCLAYKVIDKNSLPSYFNYTYYRSSDDNFDILVDFTDNSCILEIKNIHYGVFNDKFSDNFFTRILREDVEIYGNTSEYNVFKLNIVNHASTIKSLYTLSGDSYSYVDIHSSYLFSIPCNIDSIRNNSFDKVFTDLVTKIKALVK